MVYIDSIESFIEAGQQLFINSPGQTRYLVKYRHIDAKLVLKVTDNKVCLKYRTEEQSDLQRVAKLNAFFLRLMCTENVTAETAAAIAAQVDEEEQSSQTVASSPAQPQGQGSKKGGKRK